MRVTTIDPISDARWDAFVSSHPDGLIYHRSAWSRVLRESYGFEPRYYVAEDGGHFRFYNQERPHQALGYRTPRDVSDTDGPRADMAADTEKATVAQQEPESGCREEAGVTFCPWLDPDTQVLATSDTEGDSLDLAPSMFKVLGPSQNEA